jgi:hypothetical protein
MFSAFLKPSSMKCRNSHKTNPFPYNAEQLRMLRYDYSAGPHRYA